jgi:lysophospholipase L1-like esterase
LVLAIAWLLVREHQHATPSPIGQAVVTANPLQPSPKPLPELGPRHHLNYQEWVALLDREAEAIAARAPEHLSVLAGDSLTLWFPPELLPSEQTWLNQGISGETSAGLLNRLDLLDGTQPSLIYVMIGINDLLQGVSDETILANQQLIVRYLRRVHPQAQIVVQSILPHSAEQATWEGRDRLLAIPNRRIRELNERLETVAESEGALYLDLYPLFANSRGALKIELSTDGLHLNAQGYLIWSHALQITEQLLREEPLEPPRT